MRRVKNLVHFLAVIACIAIIGYFALYTDAALPDHRWIHGSNDLVFHALAFGALTVPSLALLGIPQGSFWVVAIVLLVELAQVFVPTREASLEDISSGLAGWIFVACATWFFRMRR